jgi:hypothetical protein
VVIFAFYGLNMAFRLLNTLGNVFLFFEYDVTKRNRPTTPWWRKKLVNPIASALIFWTYPQALEQKYPPEYA